jgi:type VI secretion system protein ImpK
LPENYAAGSGTLSASSLNKLASTREENLALLYQGVLTGIVRVQVGRQPIIDPNAFQRRMEDLLLEVEREAGKAGYGKEEVEEANYAVVAFLDETVLTSNDPARDRWSSWQAKRYTGSIAGEGFFEHLKVLRNRRESPQLADLLEVYYLCLLLGYQGRYAMDGASELQFLIDDLRIQIERVRGRRDVLSPDAGVPQGEPVSVPVMDPLVRNLRLAAVASVVLALFCWLVIRFGFLHFQANRVSEALNLLIAP